MSYEEQRGWEMEQGPLVCTDLVFLSFQLGPAILAMMLLAWPVPANHFAK